MMCCLSLGDLNKTRYCVFKLTSLVILIENILNDLNHGQVPVMILFTEQVANARVIVRFCHQIIQDDEIGDTLVKIC